MTPGSLSKPAGARIVWWFLPVAFLVLFYRDGLSTWFVADDFAWLSLLRLLHERHDLLHELFAPMAQGTIRPWSERGFFMLLESLFGLDALPFRLVVFATAAADVVLIAWITLRATGSRVAGFLAPLLWIVNASLVRPMTWDSTYNEVMCPLFLLGALSLFIRYLDTKQRKYWWWQLVVFSLGFGALEINVVYPALAAAWILFAQTPQSHDRKGAVSRLTTILPQTAISTLYFLLHHHIAPIPTTGPYALFFDRSILKNLALYWTWSLIPQRFGHGHTLEILAVIIVSLAIAAFVATELIERRKTVLFFLSWFAITVAPVLPLSGHRTDYYMTIPVIGLAMLGGAAAGQYWNGPFIQRACMVIPLGVYLFAMIPVTRALTHWWLVRSLEVRTLVLGVIAGRQTHPGKVILLDGVNTDLFNLSFTNPPFFASDINGVYLTEESAINIHPDPDLGQLKRLVPEPEALWHGITHDQVVVYYLESDHLRNITEGYARQLASRTVLLSGRLPSHVDVGNILYSWLLGPAWLSPEDGVRWMPASATLRLGVPAGGTSLEIEGSCPGSQLLAAPRHLMVLVDGVVAADTRIYDPETNFRRLFPMPAVLAGKKSVEVQIRVDPVDRKDGQDYGLVFGNIAIRP